MSHDFKAEVKIYTTPWCPYCVRAKKLLDKKQVAYEDFNVAYDNALRAEVSKRSGRTSVPQIFINDQPIGGCDELHELEARGELDALLMASSTN